MTRYFITFPTGTSDIVQKVLTENHIAVEEISDGIAVIATDKKPRDIEEFGFITHVYLLIAQTIFNDSIEKTVDSLKTESFRIPASFFRGRNFKVRVSYKGQTVSFDKEALDGLEKRIAHNYKLRLDPEGKCNEFWFYIRENKNTYFGLKLTDTKARDIARKKGQLQSGIGAVMVSMAKIQPSAVVMDPFCGSGGISDEIIRVPFKQLIISDINDGAVRLLKKKYSSNAKVKIRHGDYRSLSIPRDSVDCIITDPPWGEFGKGIDLQEMTHSFRMWLKPNGKLIILISINLHEELVRTLKLSGFKVLNAYGTLVGGNKAKIIEARKCPHELLTP
ncbi:methyltransferase domain-containing protein [Candidatus Kaiserbacteria bacterium]|nr:methyltransferase domain-containing protein [Candidatus Kaiserbacteria bacterium]